MKGKVIESTGAHYRVVGDSGAEFSCTARGRLRLEGKRTTNPVAVGDIVEFEVGDVPATGVITALAPRRNYIIRRASNLSKESHILAANLDGALLIVSLKNPVTPTEFIDRFLVTCEAYSIPATIVLNKTDIEDSDEFVKIYEAAGYEVIRTQVVNGVGLERIKELTAGKTTLLAGNSGVGKSSLIKALVPTANPRIGQVSSSHSKGMHTTTFARLYAIPSGGALIDTPGIKGFGLIDIAPNELAHYFPEMMRYASSCQYYNCTHTHEPQCAVIAAVQSGNIAIQRYESYLKMLDGDGKYR